LFERLFFFHSNNFNNARKEDKKSMRVYLNEVFWIGGWLESQRDRTAEEVGGGREKGKKKRKTLFKKRNKNRP